jgi:hypothetical protein
LKTWEAKFSGRNIWAGVWSESNPDLLAAVSFPQSFSLTVGLADGYPRFPLFGRNAADFTYLIFDVS